jgi:threonylcarbamoyladenosine tRNA methylthiotransferase CDKAL1
MATLHLLTFGCSLNRSDAEVLRGLLEQAGHLFVEEEKDADLIIYNSCTVKSAPEQRLFSFLRQHKKPVLVTGCVPQADPGNPLFQEVSVLGPRALSRVVEVVERTLAGERVSFLEDVDHDRPLLPACRTQGVIGILPINAGCLSKCSFCKTVQARGSLKSYEPKILQAAFRALLQEGVKEVWLTSQDTGAYGKDSGTTLPAFVEGFLSVPGEYRLRIGMANPQHVLPQLDAWVRILKQPNVFRFLHLPLQSGSDRVLKDMRRGYTVASFRAAVERLRQEIPDLTIATDIIVGYPTEDEEDFQETLKIIQELRIPVVNLSKFYPRPGTPAASLKLLPTTVVKRRSTELKKVCNAIAAENHRSLIGIPCGVLIDERGKNGTLIGRTDTYLQVILPQDAAPLGARLIVTPTAAGVFDLKVPRP